LRDRLRAVTAISVALATAWAAFAITPVAAAETPAPLKVVIIVGPTGSQTSDYRGTGNDIADVAEEAGAEVVKVYSPRATWARVRNAVEGANVVVYLGHGNGYPNPYGSTELGDRHNGWGLNRTTRNGDKDDWSRTMVYCGEKALRGTLTASEGAAQWKYCGGANGTQGINPAANWVMIYNKACYAPGAGEGWDAKATEKQALRRVTNYSTPVLLNNGGAYFATDMWQGGEQLVDLVLRNRDVTFGDIAQAANGFDMFAQRRFAHSDTAGAEVWLQRTGSSFGGTDYWFAYAGDPDMTPSGVLGEYVAPPPPTVVAASPSAGAVGATATSKVTATFDQQVTRVSSSSFTVTDAWGLTVPGTVSYSATTRRATFTPNVPLEAGMTYKATLTGMIRGLSAPLARQSWTFSVAGTVDPSITLYGDAQALVLEPGTNTRYRFTLTGQLRAEQTATLGVATTVGTRVGRSLPGQKGRWFHVTSGAWAGYWVRESSAAHLPDEGASTAAAAAGPLTARIRPGTHTGYVFDEAGGLLTVKTKTISARDASADQLATLPGQTGQWLHMTGGGWSGYWLRVSSVVIVLD
jgi:hypothetical protein